MTAAGALLIDEHEALTRDGWRLELRRTVSPAHLRPGARPVVIVPGYGMNNFIFGFHPRGTSMERCLAEAGFETWSVNLRRQGGSRPLSRSAPGPSLRAYADQDLPALLDAVVARTRTGADMVDVIGASLGGSIAYAHVALVPEHRVASLVAIGAPLRWTEVHRVLGLLFASPRIVGALRLWGSRQMARAAMGVVGRFPSLISIYMNAGHVDMTAAARMVETVEDPHPRVNRDIAKWINARDMVLAGVNITEALARVRLPLLVITSNRDGIVPEGAALSVRAAWGGGDVTVLRIGDDDDWFAHADLFIAHESPAKVFAPIASWLTAKQ